MNPLFMQSSGPHFCMDSKTSTVHAESSDYTSIPFYSSESTDSTLIQPLAGLMVGITEADHEASLLAPC